MGIDTLNWVQEFTKHQHVWVLTSQGWQYGQVTFTLTRALRVHVGNTVHVPGTMYFIDNRAHIRTEEEHAAHALAS